ncbi:hybrid sensor histidine kinase/response regulator [Geothrix sp. PMB-07]|uniref:hybrid sensor histidine kinase/response regulator n=1 Tax=Geothrix sp. PMB-07 TaxID=3068640 RepID=UPI002740A646|nr:hybrid sensor histidine kinase/response regulator [Geothrix sp. PMB-07]WLT33283.1 hybrid sensor histidine kinase/response regulator [Geothrix sp. PMB-07]
MNDGPLFFRRADHGARILVVDDDALARRSLRAMLERGYYQVETAEGGEKALELLSTYKPELVLLDIQMPHMDGLEVCRRIRDLPNGELLPIIFLTGDERPDIHAQALRAKGDDFLRKPVLSPELIVRIRSLMRLKRLQAEVQAERDNLLDLQKQREQLFEFIVHDLKNPLSAIQVGLELMDERDETSPTSKAQLRRLRDTAHTMGRMIQNILDIGRAEQVGLDLHKSSIPLSAWLPSLLKEMESQAKSRSHILSWDCDPDLHIEADQEFLRRLLLNLLDNALKYSPSGSRTWIEAQKTESGVRLEVRDEGHGIPEEMRDQIFGKFVRVKKEGHDPHFGSGLGLAFCQLVAEAHEGRIWVEDNLPKGSAFVLELPKARPARHGESGEAADEPTGGLA